MATATSSHASIDNIPTHYTTSIDIAGIDVETEQPYLRLAHHLTSC